MKYPLKFIKEIINNFGLGTFPILEMENNFKIGEYYCYPIISNWFKTKLDDYKKTIEKRESSYSNL